MRVRRKKDKVMLIVIGIELIIIICLLVNIFTKYNTTKVKNNANKEEKVIDKNVNKESKKDTKNNVNEKSNNSKQKDENANFLDKVSYNNLNVDSEIHKLIVEYMNSYYKSIKNLEYYDIKNLFNNEVEAYENETAIKYLIEARKLRNFDMTLSNVKFDLEYKKYNVKENVYQIEILENGYYNFNFMKDITSKVYGVKNTFEIVKTDNGYKIRSFDKVQDFYVMFTNAFKNTGDYKSEYDSIKTNYLKEVEKEQENLKKYKDEYSKYKITKNYDHKYDRNSAISYAKKYVTERNDKWTKYDDIGGNCQNYASQVLIEGGIPMDSTGDIISQWKHYSSSVNEKSTKEGRSYSWTGVGYFYRYAKNNTGFGLVSEVDANYYAAEPGDIAQVGYGNEYRHTIVVVDLAKDENGNILDLIINSNTVNMENFPLQGYVYPMKRIIKILGYNE